MTTQSNVSELPAQPDRILDGIGGDLLLVVLGMFIGVASETAIIIWFLFTH